MINKLRNLMTNITCVVLLIVFIAASTPQYGPTQANSVSALFTNKAVGKTFIPAPGTEFDPFPFVGSIHTSSGYLVGSGVLVSPNLVLTAAHVTMSIPFPTKITFDGGKTFIGIKKVRYHDSYIVAKRLHLSPNETQGDIAVILLEKSVDISFIQMNPASLYEYRGDPIIVIGFGHGMKAFTLAGAATLYGTLEGEDSLIWLALPAFAMGGDSGGAVLFHAKSGQLLLAGIVKSRIQLNGVICDSRATRIDRHFPWLQETMRELTADQ